jgi:hypothetical protein
LAAKDKYPNPFCDIASEYMPTSVYEMFDLAEYLWNTMPPFREISCRVVRYFLTEIELEGGDDNEREEFKLFLDENLNLVRELGAIGDDFLCYGQSFFSINFPFDRFLMCPDCGTQYKSGLIQQKFKADPRDPSYEAVCPKCDDGRFKRFIRVDRRSPDKSRVRVNRWNPRHIKIEFHPISKSKRFYLDLSADGVFAQKIREGNEFMLNEAPWPIIKTCCAGSNLLFQFSKDKVYHLGAPTLAGMYFHGWSVPPLLSSFKLAYYIQLMRRFDEAMILDYIVPFRVMYPENTAAGQDSLMAFNMGSFVNELKQMVARKRKNITDIQIAPFKIGYQLLGGEAKMFSPKENILQSSNELLNNCGYPAELYNGTLNWQVMPVALRMFERRWGDLVYGLNAATNWLIQECAKHYGWSKEISGKLRSVTLADDLERKALALQGAAGGDISKGTAYSAFGMKFEEEQGRVLEEQRMIAKLQQEAQEEDQAQQLGGGQGGDPAQQGGYQPSMEDIRSQAQSLATQLLFQVPEGQRRSQLMKIKQTNPTLHALVIQSMDEQRRQMASQGQQMLMQQNQQAAAAGQQVKTAADMPSMLSIGILVQDQAISYTRKELRKIACDVRKPGVDKAFSMIYGMITGRTGVL